MWANPWGGSWPIHQSAYQNVPHEQGKYMFVIWFIYVQNLPLIEHYIRMVSVKPQVQIWDSLLVLRCHHWELDVFKVFFKYI